MRVLGIDFTSAPQSRKPITCLHCDFVGGLLHAKRLERLLTFEDFDARLRAPGSWIAGIDFPFGQAKRFIKEIGWPPDWPDYVAFAGKLTRKGFCDVLNAFRASRPAGEKEFKRKTDIAAGSISPQKLYGVPVGLMFFEGAPRLRKAGVTIPFLQAGDPNRIVVEAYPGVLARRLIGPTATKAIRPRNKRRHSTWRVRAF